MHGIDQSGLKIRDLTAPKITRGDLALVHDSTYVEIIEAFCSAGGGSLDADTPASSGTWEAALTAAGGVKAVVEALSDLEDATGFVVARPPGHHALRDRAMGFCIFNNVAITGGWLRAQGKRVAILDWDVHHGNGTQAMLGPDPGVLYASIHQAPFYPHEGLADDIDLDAKGTTINVPLPAGSAGDVVREAWAELVLPVVEQFRPDWVLVSAGYDAHINDDLADMRLIADDYGWMAHGLASRHPPNRTVYALEGGYDLDALATSVSATLRGAGGESDWMAPLVSRLAVTDALDPARRAIAGHWSI
jgi:acetoin utilization deacetylase AcuC-like enzyme